jgi:hypothetical protein
MVLAHTVKPMSQMCLTSLQKCNRARWQMLFHPTTLTLDFCNPLTSGQMCMSCASWTFTKWNITQKNLLFIDDSSRTPLHLTAILHSGWLRETPTPSPTPMLPGPEIVFRPVHQKSSVNSTKHHCNIHSKAQFEVKFQFSLYLATNSSQWFCFTNR